MSSNNKPDGGGFAVTVIFTLSVFVLVLIFILFTRDQGNKQVEETLTDLVQTNQELQKEKKQEFSKPLEERLKEAGIESESLWVKEKDCDEPYCLFSKLTSGRSASDDEKDFVDTRGIVRWKGFYEDYQDKGGADCDAFILEEDHSVHSIDMSLLAGIEQTLLKQSTNDEPTQLTVFFRENENPADPCNRPAIVLNVHFE